MDVYAACSGSVYSLSVGAQYIQTGKYETVLCVGAECLSRITDYTDRGTCILLADAAGAAVLRPTDGDAGIIDTDLYSDGRYGELLMPARRADRAIPPPTRRSTSGMHFAKMKGNEVFKVAVRMFGDCAAAHPRAQRVHSRPTSTSSCLTRRTCASSRPPSSASGCRWIG